MKNFNYGPPFPNRGDTRGVHTNRDDRGYLEGFPFTVSPSTGLNVVIIDIMQDIDAFSVSLHQGAGNAEVGVWPHDLGQFPHVNAVATVMRPWWLFNTDTDRTPGPFYIPRNTYKFTIANLSGAGNIARGCLTVWRFGSS